MRPDHAEAARVAVSVLSHDGLVRDHNEDSAVVGAWTLCASTTLAVQTLQFPGNQQLVVAVADGLGGHPAGEVASSVAAQYLARAGTEQPDEEAVRRLVERCNEAVYAEAGLDPERTGMGTTIAGIVLTDDVAVVFNVGDSRVYAVDADGTLTQLSQDDNPPLRPGETHTPVLTQMLGGHPRPTAVDVHVTARPRASSERYLVCTDGLTDVLDDDEIAEVLRAERGGVAAYELWRATIEAGAPDNVTLAVVESSFD